MFENYADYEILFAQLQLIFFMIGMGATLSPADFARIVRVPKFLIVGAIMQIGVLPLLAVSLNNLFHLPEGIAVGMVLVAAMPGGTLSKLFVYLGRGNVALTITLTAVLTLGSLITVPLLLGLLAQGYLPGDFTMPVGRVVTEVGLFLVLPLGVGLLIGRLSPRWRLTISRLCVGIGLGFVLAVIFGSLGSGRIQPGAYGWRPPVAIVLFSLLGQQLAMLPFRLMRWPAEDCLAVGVEVTMRNINLALLLYTNFEGEIKNGVLFVVLYYGATAFFVGAPLALRYRFFKRQPLTARRARGEG